MAISTCSACGKVFHSTGAFDTHRTGEHYNKTRRCMTEEEMIASGMHINKFGKWERKPPKNSRSF